MRPPSAKRPAPTTLAALRECLAAIEQGGTDSSPVVPTGWTEIDESLGIGGLRRGAVHEWFGLGAPSATRRWTPPLAVLVHLSQQAIARAESSLPLFICWIGKRIWPSARALSTTPLSQGSLLNHSLFVDAPDASSRLWAVDTAARSGSVVVVADGSGFDMAATRRLQLACEASDHPVLLARPPNETVELSAAFTRFSIEREVSTGEDPCFRVCILRSKGVGSLIAPDRMFMLSRQSNGRLVGVPSQLRSRPVAPSLAG